MRKDKSYMSFLKENLGMDSGVASISGVTGPVGSADMFLDPNAPILNMYSNGDSFSVHDNASLYEVIKIFKDFTDRQPELQSVGYAIDVNNKCLLFNAVIDNDHIMSSDALSGIVEIMRVEIQKRFGDTFDIKSEEKDLFGQIGQNVGLGPSQGKRELRITVSEKNTDKDS